MLDLKKLISSVEACLGWPYVSPGTNDARGIDCSGLFVKAFRDQGSNIYHGSNSIYRKYCNEKGPITSEAQLCPGMAVFKWNPNTPEKFADSLGDFQHIGLVTSINPLRIVHHLPFAVSIPFLPSTHEPLLPCVDGIFCALQPSFMAACHAPVTVTGVAGEGLGTVKK